MTVVAGIDFRTAMSGDVSECHLQRERALDEHYLHPVTSSE